MYYHAPCGVVLYTVICKLYGNKKARRVDSGAGPYFLIKKGHSAPIYCFLSMQYSLFVSQKMFSLFPGGGG